MPQHSTIRRVIKQALTSALHALLILGLASADFGYHSAAGVAAARATETSPEASTDFEALVGPVALYPDELLAIVLPASTYPVHIVQAARFLEARKTDAELEPDEEWDESIIGLLNYPEVIELMNNDLNWTWALGAAFTDHEGDVMDAVQDFRAKVDKAGNLQTNDKVKVVKETPELEEGETLEPGEQNQQVIIIESASPEVIYVPQYQPTTVVVYQAAPYPYYYSPPYPYYYRPGALFWTGLVVGTAVGFGLRWGRRGYRRGGVRVNRNVNVNVNVNSRKNNLNAGGRNWNDSRRKDKASKGGARPGAKNAGSRPSGGQRDRAAAGTGGKTSPGARASAGQGAGNRAAAGGQTRPSSQAAPSAGGGRDRSSTSARQMTSPSSSSHTGSSPNTSKQSSPRGSSVGNYGSGSSKSARSHSSRGRSSRSGGGGHHGGGRRR